MFYIVSFYALNEPQRIFLSKMIFLSLKIYWAGVVVAQMPCMCEILGSSFPCPQLHGTKKPSRSGPTQLKKKKGKENVLWINS